MVLGAHQCFSLSMVLGALQGFSLSMVLGALQGFSLSMVLGALQGFSLSMVLGALQGFSLSMVLPSGGFRLSMILGALQGFSLSMVLGALQGFSLSMDYSFSCRADPSRLPPLNLPPVPDLRHTPLPPLWRVPSPLPWLQPVARTMAPRLTSRLQPRRWGGSVLRIQRFSWTPLDPNAPRPRLHYYSGHDPLKNKEEPRSVTMDDTGLEIKGEDQAAQNQRENQNQGVGLLPLDQTRPGIRGRQGPEEPLVGPLMFAISEPSGTVPQNREMATPVLMHCFEGRKGPGRQSSLAALHTRQLDPRSDLHNLHDLQESGGTSGGVVRGTLPQVLREFQARQSMGSLLLGPDGEVLQLSLYENHADRLQLAHRDEVTEEEKVHRGSSSTTARPQTIHKALLPGKRPGGSRPRLSSSIHGNRGLKYRDGPENKERTKEGFEEEEERR
ncbi:unnamed protein product [Arctogadus glacialis]